MNRKNFLIFFASVCVFLGLSTFAAAAGLVAGTEFVGDNQIMVTFNTGVDQADAADVTKYTVFEETDPDIRLSVTDVEISEDGKRAILSFADPLNTAQTHIVSAKGIGGIDPWSFERGTGTGRETGNDRTRNRTRIP